jgi:hypothetical protein
MPRPQRQQAMMGAGKVLVNKRVTFFSLQLLFFKKKTRFPEQKRAAMVTCLCF